MVKKTVLRVVNVWNQRNIYLLIYFFDSINELIQKNLSFIRINWMGAKSKAYKIDWLYPATIMMVIYQKSIVIAMEQKKTKKSYQIRSNKNINMMSKDFLWQSKSPSPF